MRTKSFILAFALLSGILSAVAQQTDKTWQSNATAYIHQQEYQFYPADNNSFRAANSRNRITCNITPAGYIVQPQQTGKNENWQVEFAIQHIGRKETASFFSSNAIAVQQTTELVYHSRLVDVEYLNSEKGLRQNFIVKEKPKGDGPLQIQLALFSSLQCHLINNEQLVFTDVNNETKFMYEDLKVWDAGKHIISAKMELNKATGILSLVVDDKNAIYPVTIDPLNKVPEWTSSADGILPGLLTNLQLQVNTLYGYNVTGLGDINDDGFDDVAISAPGMANVVAGVGNLANVGAVFIYLGSSLGLSATPSKVLQPTTAITGALFGFSIDAGDVTGDSIPDIIISAPLDTYQTTAAGLLGDVNVTVGAGKVYFYRSENLFSTANPSPFLQIRLQGHNFFSTGVLGLLNNISIHPLFGFSVAITDDLNGDDLKDIIIGAPAYLGTAPLSVQAGAAFVYYSDTLTVLSGSPVKLNVPTSSVLGLISLPLVNTSGLLYGFSVDGAGDYNNDGHPDVVVGAPAGINLSSLGGIFSGQVLGGSAYVYFSNGSTISASIGASLQGSPSGLLSNAANLFGYKVKGVRNGSGTRTGNILVSAPTGSVLSNIVSGLRLKAGGLHVFRKKTAAFSNPIVSDQVLSSPRSSSLLSILTGQTINVSLLYGASVDNASDMNCDGFGDLIVGEPLSTSVPIIGANITGGAAYLYIGKADGTYQATPSWSVFPQVSPLLGINATALVGFSVAGAGYIKGTSENRRILVGGPSNTLDFGPGLLNIGNTLGTLSSFAFDNNGIGKAYEFDPNLCSFTTLPVNLVEFSGYALDNSVQLNWKSQLEENFSHYEVERSTDSTRFKTISVVFGKGETVNKYDFPDKEPYQGINYYRLKMVDNDAKFSYSPIVVVRFISRLQGMLAVTPNPVRSEFKIRLTAMEKGTYQLKLFNAVGQLMQTKSVTVTQHQQTVLMPPVINYPNGIYWLNVYDTKGKKVNEIKVSLRRD